MTDDAQRWKAKYLENLEQQEKLEQRWEARLDLLRRGLVLFNRVSFVVLGAPWPPKVRTRRSTSACASCARSSVASRWMPAWPR